MKRQPDSCALLVKFKTTNGNYLLILYIVTILVLSTIAISNGIELNKKWLFGIRYDYIIHMLMFIPWMILVRLNWKKSWALQIFFLALAAGLFLIGVSEGIQAFIPARTTNPKDLLANGIGLFLGGMISLIGKNRSRVME